MQFLLLVLGQLLMWSLNIGSCIYPLCTNISILYIGKFFCFYCFYWFMWTNNTDKEDNTRGWSIFASKYKVIQLLGPQSYIQLRSVAYWAIQIFMTRYLGTIPLFSQWGHCRTTTWRKIIYKIYWINAHIWQTFAHMSSIKV